MAVGTETEQEGMKPNHLIIIGILVAAGIIAAVVLSPKPEPTVPPKAAIASPTTQPVDAIPPASPVTAEVAPVAPHSPTMIPGGMGSVGMAVGVTEASIAARPIAPALGPMHEPEDVAKAVATMVELAGGEAAMKPLLAAKWKLVATAMTRTLFLEMTTDAKGGLAIKDEQTGTIRYRVGGKCRVQRGASVLSCRRADLLLVGALFAAERASVPLRFAKEVPVQTKDDNGGYFELPAPEVDTLGYWNVDRDTGTIPSVGPSPWAELKLENRTSMAGVKLPTVWLLSASMSAIEAGSRGKGKVAYVSERNPSVVSIRVMAVQPIKEKSTISMPALLGEGPMQVGPRPELKAIVRPANGMARLPEVVEGLEHSLPFEQLLDTEIQLGLAPPALPLSPGRSLEAWLVTQPEAATAIGDPTKVSAIPAEPAMARRVIKVNPADLNDQLAKFLASVKAAGHDFGTSRVVARPLSETIEDGMLVEFLVPVLPKPVQ